MSSFPGLTARRWLKRVALVLVWCGLGALTVWAVAALVIDLRSSWFGPPLAVVYLVVVAAMAVRLRASWKRFLPPLLGFSIVLGWWLTLQPSNDRDWQPDVAILPYAEIAGDRVTIHNIRNCDYRSRTDYDVRVYDKSFDLSKLQSTELYLVNWGVPIISHTMVSFGFEGGDYVCFSIETRLEKDEPQSSIRGFFRQFELIYVVADEQDVVRLRTNYRGDDQRVRLYQLNVSPEAGRKLFLEYLHRVNQLKEQPEWYNAVTDNCTTAIRAQRSADERAPWNWRLLVNGYLDELLYERSFIPTDMPLAELRERCLIDKKGRAADRDADFSQRIRVGLPGIGQEP